MTELKPLIVKRNPIKTVKAHPTAMPTNEPYGVLMKGKIDYSKIDESVRPLVRSLNRLGAKTLSSCSGHDNGDEAYVSFTCNQKVLAEIIMRMDGREDLTSGLHNGFNVNIGDNTSWFVTISCHASSFEGKLRYTLRFECPSIAVTHSILQIMGKKIRRRRT